MTCDCGTQTTRGIFRDGHWICKSCHPEEFTEPNPKTPIEKNHYFEWEARPNMYVKRENRDGSPLYIAKDELKAEWEDKLAKPTQDETRIKNESLSRKRAKRRTKQMTPAERDVALRKAAEVAEAIAKRKQEAERLII